MVLTAKQRKQVDAIATLVTQPDRSSITQGIELASALGDQAVFAELLSGIGGGKPKLSDLPYHKRYPSPRRASIFDRGTGIQAWLGLAMFHLLAASELPERRDIRSIMLGSKVRKLADPAPTLWLDGLEKLESLTHLDLHLSTNDQDIDLSPLEFFPKLTHLRIRGTVIPGPFPSMEKLEVLDSTKIRIEQGASFPSLKSIRGQVLTDAPMSPERMPNLVEIDVRKGIQIEGFESLDKLACSGGAVSVTGCRRIGHLSVSADSFSAPDLRHVGLLDRGSPGIDVAQFESLDQVQLNRNSKFVGGVFPEGVTLLHPKVVLWGPGVTSLGNIGELPGLELLVLSRVSHPVSLETLRHATDLTTLDIRNSPGITDLSPLIALANLEVLVINKAERDKVPPELDDRVQTTWRPYRVPGVSDNVL